MAGPDVICVGSSGAAQVVLKRVEREVCSHASTLNLLISNHAIAK